MSQNSKIFCIGLPKTGTLSLHTALLQLGMNSVHYPINDVIPGLQSGDYTVIDKYDAFVNCGEWHFAALDKRFPGSKFIYTWRVYDKWIISMKKHFERYEIPERGTNAYLNRLGLFGTVTFDEQIMETIYLAHVSSIERYFSNKSNLLKLNVASEKAYLELCTYLGMPAINTSFPHKNAADKK